MDLGHAVALVTGAASGIGRATAMRLAAAGASVVCADVDVAGGEQVVDDIEGQGGTAAFVRADVAHPIDVRTMVENAMQRYGGLDIVVNNAGVIEALTTQRTTFPDVEPQRWMRMLDINLRGVILVTQQAIHAMRRRRGGVIINIASGAGVGYGPHDAPVYAASKAGVVRFSAALAALHQRNNIRVNCICPGWVDTPMSRRARAETPDDEWRAFAPAVMLRDEDIAEGVVAFINDEALAGRVMLYFEAGKPWRLLPVTADT
jgi:NAD(P)-dependent dehydrogenase (short-subunit alcohol dehydrogenase family)